jgi:hypothetical protein
MASGIGGTLRFTGIVVGFAALGAILFDRVTMALRLAAPDLADGQRLALAQHVVAGDLSGAHDLALASFGAGYQGVFFTAAVIAGISAVATWLLVRSSDTAPAAHDAGVAALPVE